MVLGKLPVPGRPTIWITVGQGPIALAVGAGGGGLDIFTLIYPSLLSPSLLETARYRLKYCLKGPLNPKQPTNQSLLATLITYAPYSVDAIGIKIHAAKHFLIEVQLEYSFYHLCESKSSTARSINVHHYCKNGQTKYFIILFILK